MLFLSPAPSMIVVSSLPTMTFFALPSISRVVLSSFIPISSLMSWPPVTMAMSSSNRFAAISESWRFHGADFQSSAEAVDDESCESFAIDIFSDDQEGFSGFCNGLEEGNDVFDCRNFLFVNEDVSNFHRCTLAFQDLS